MDLKKPKAHPSLVNGGGFRSNRSAVNGEACQRKSIEPIDHWSFLEEFEAPMWADLRLESMSMDQDVDDSWFQVAHPFHQVSSYQLMSTSSVFGEEKADVETNLVGKSPRQLPNSVSKSRGKDYKSRKWRGGKVDKQHPIRVLGRKTIRVTSVTPKVKTGFVDVKNAVGLKGRSTVQGTSIDTRRPSSMQRKPSYRNSENTLSFKSNWSSDTSTYNRKATSCRTTPSFGDSSTSSSSANFEGKSNLTGRNGPDIIKHGGPLGDSVITCNTRPNSVNMKLRSVDLDSTSSVYVSSLTEKNSVSFDVPHSFEQKSNFGVLKRSSNSIVSTGSEDNSRESQMTSDAARPILGQASGLLSSVRLSLRKSCVTRQPSRVEIKDKRQSKGHSSSSGKSSVGSTSELGCKPTDLAARTKKSVTPESRAVEKTNQSTNDNKVNGKYLSKTSMTGLLDFIPDFKQEGGTNTARLIRQEISKSKVLCHFERGKPLRLQNVQDSYSGGTKSTESLPTLHKVNVARRGVSRKKVEDKENIVGNLKACNDTAKLKVDKGLTGAKEAKAIERNTRKNVVRRTYFR